jgi:pyruvate formate lyase activating enzyme
MPQATVQDLLESRTREGVLYDALPDGSVRCYACGHECLIRPGRQGICRVRFNRDGRLQVPWEYVAALQIDPIEKKPFFHAHPGATALSFGMLGCDYHCGYCQNWFTSQSLRDAASTTRTEGVTAAQIVGLALRHGCRVVTSTYNEPLITSEWAVEVFREVRRAGLATSYVSNGNGTEQVLDYLRPWVDLYKVDLKGFDDRRYRSLGGVLERVLATIRGLKQRGFWVEIVTLLVPGFSDDPDELRRMAAFLASVDPLMPWHVTAFHPDYKMLDRDSTATDALLRAAEIGREEGLAYIYAGNLPGHVGNWEDTRCHGCGATVIRRHGFRVLENRLQSDRCPDCSTRIPGVWGRSSG